MRRGNKEDCHFSLEDPDLVRRINRIVLILVHPPQWREDFRQEALIHFWRAAEAHPGKTLRWYLRSCYFRLRNLLKLGRSIDSLKHQDSQQLVEGTNRDQPLSAAELPSQSDVRQEVCLNDTVFELFRLLKPKDRRILVLLAEGNSAPDIAELLKLKGSTVCRTRQRIAAAAVKIGFAPGRQ